MLAFKHMRKKVLCLILQACKDHMENTIYNQNRQFTKEI